MDCSHQRQLETGRKLCNDDLFHRVVKLPVLSGGLDQSEQMVECIKVCVRL